MRILFLSTYDRPEFQRKLDYIANCREIEMLCVFPEKGKVLNEIRVSEDGHHQYYVRTLPLGQLGRHGDPHRVFYKTLDYHIRTFKPDLIHCDHEQEGLLAAQVTFCRNLFSPRIPLVLYSWQNLLRKRSLPVLAICQYTLQNAQHITCASVEGMEVLRKQGFRGSCNIAPMIGIDPTVFYPYSYDKVQTIRAQLGLTEDDFVVGFVGRISPEKSIETLLSAVSKMTTKCHLLIVGSGISEVENSLKSLAVNLGIIDRCRFIAHQENAIISDYINGMDVMVLPSKTTSHWKEQFGRVLVEAMLCKRLVVGSNSGAIPEVINQSDCVFIENNSMDLANILDKLSKKTLLCENLINANYERANRLYSVSRIATQNIEIWQDILNNKNRK